jgi:hypothetical protein
MPSQRDAEVGCRKHGDGDDISAIVEFSADRLDRIPTPHQSPHGALKGEIRRGAFGLVFA